MSWPRPGTLAAFGRLQDACLLLTALGLIEDVNPAAETMLGDRRTLVGRAFRDLVRSEMDVQAPRELEAPSEVANPARRVTRGLRLTGAHGEPFSANLSCFRLGTSSAARLAVRIRRVPR